tara:strand:+ start:488 stop:664 length:177 start_codon:yes stop_codon:yes gene_type:complete
MVEFSEDMRANSAKVTAFAGWGVYVCINTEDPNPNCKAIRNVDDGAHLVKSERWTYKI